MQPTLCPRLDFAFSLRFLGFWRFCRPRGALLGRVGLLLQRALTQIGPQVFRDEVQKLRHRGFQSGKSLLHWPARRTVARTVTNKVVVFELLKLLVLVFFELDLLFDLNLLGLLFRRLFEIGELVDESLVHDGGRCSRGKLRLGINLVSFGFRNFLQEAFFPLEFVFLLLVLVFFFLLLFQFVFLLFLMGFLILVFLASDGLLLRFQVVFLNLQRLFILQRLLGKILLHSLLLFELSRAHGCSPSLHLPVAPVRVAATCDLTFNGNSESGGESVSPKPRGAANSTSEVSRRNDFAMLRIYALFVPRGLPATTVVRQTRQNGYGRHRCRLGHILKRATTREN